VTADGHLLLGFVGHLSPRLSRFLCRSALSVHSVFFLRIRLVHGAQRSRRRNRRLRFGDDVVDLATPRTTALGLLSGYPVVMPESGDSVTRRRYRVQRSNRRLGSPPLAAPFFDAWPIAGPSIAVDAPSLGGVRNAGHEWRTTCIRYRRLANIAYRSLAESAAREPLVRAGRGVLQRN